MHPRTNRGTLVSILALGASFGPISMGGAAEPAQALDLASADAPAGAVWLDALDLSKLSQDWGAPGKGKSVDGAPLTLAGKVYRHGIGTHARSELVVDLRGAALRFDSVVGVDDEKEGFGTVVFQVIVDGKTLADTGVLRGGEAPKAVSADLTGARRMILVVEDGGDGINHDHADWAGALLTLDPKATERPRTVEMPMEPPPSIASSTRPEPAIHGPRITGATPLRPFLFLVPATGEGPLEFSAKGLPAGLSIDPQTGIISGSLQAEGRTAVELRVSGPKGEARRGLTIVGGRHQLALTPPMGWNSWNVWAGAIDDAKVRDAAEWLVRSGLAAHGFQYINIDDTWEGTRDEKGEIRTNEKFPDMTALADHVHSLGLKLGIYSSPGPKTCAGFEGSFGHEEQDARTWARWGIDYLKHDWCSCRSKDLQAPYRLMRAALDGVDRDIVYSLCQYGMGDVWTWGADVGGNLWRTTGDISDSWGSMAGIGFSQAGHETYAGPGHWNDPDMLVVGRVGWGPSLHPSRLRPQEQITHITLWSLLASPLLIGCDLTQIDAFTLALLTNDEVLDVNQDPLGRQAARLVQKGPLEVWGRPLWNGTFAVGLFNRSTTEAEVRVTWKDLGMEGTQLVRDLWLQKDLGSSSEAFAAKVPGHGAVLLRIGTPTKGDEAP